MKIIVTGATGYIGSNTCKALLERGHTVLGLLRESSNTDFLLTTAPKTKLMRYHSYYDLQDIVQEENADAIIHLAASFDASDNFDQITKLLRDNIEFTTFLLKSAMGTSLQHLIYACSSWQFDDNFNESSQNLYASTKNAANQILEYFTKLQNLNFLKLALFDVYGPFDPRSKLISSLPSFARRNSCLELSPGKQTLDLVYIDDVCSAFSEAIELCKNSRHQLRESYTVRTGKVHTLEYLLNYFNDVSGKQMTLKFGCKPYRNNEIMHPPLINKPIPNWQSSMTAENGLKAVWETYQKNESYIIDNI